MSLGLAAAFLVAFNLFVLACRAKLGFIAGRALVRDLLAGYLANRRKRFDLHTTNGASPRSRRDS